MVKEHAQPGPLGNGEVVADGTGEDVLQSVFTVTMLVWLG
jgi:hypothetical protein